MHTPSIGQVDLILPPVAGESPADTQARTEALVAQIAHQLLQDSAGYAATTIEESSAVAAASDAISEPVAGG